MRNLLMSTIWYKFASFIEQIVFRMFYDAFFSAYTICSYFNLLCNLVFFFFCGDWVLYPIFLWEACLFHLWYFFWLYTCSALVASSTISGYLFPFWSIYLSIYKRLIFARRINFLVIQWHVFISCLRSFWINVLKKDINSQYPYLWLK